MRTVRAFLIALCFGIVCPVVWGADLSWAALTIYGPKKFVRGTGKPVTITETFPAPSVRAHYKLTVLNGEKGQYRTSSAIIKIDGTEILSEKDFSQQVDRMERDINLQDSNSLSVELRSAPGSFLTIMIECLDCIDIWILSPHQDATTNSLTVLVKGTILAMTDDVGVTVNGFLASVNGNNWDILLSLNEGTNTITAKITDFFGNGAQKSITLYAEDQGESLSLSANPESGVLPLSVNFSVSTALSSPLSYEVDFEGDGVVDSVFSTVENITHIYSQAGIYYPSVTAKDTLGNIHTGFALVHVLDETKIDALLRSRWEEMKNALYNRDIDGGLNSFLESSKEVYRQAFDVIEDELPQIVSDMQYIEMIYLKENVAKYRICRVHSIEGTLQTITYYIYFSKDSDGIWRIDRF